MQFISRRPTALPTGPTHTPVGMDSKTLGVVSNDTHHCAADLTVEGFGGDVGIR